MTVVMHCVPLAEAVSSFGAVCFGETDSCVAGVIMKIVLASEFAPSSRGQAVWYFKLLRSAT